MCHVTAKPKQFDIKEPRGSELQAITLHYHRFDLFPPTKSCSHVNTVSSKGEAIC